MTPPTDLTFTKLEAITNSFSVERKVGRGGFGEVYKGVLDDGTEIAVKKLHPMPGTDDEQFKKEFNNLMKVQHKNIIKLTAYCFEIRKIHFEDDRGEYRFANIEERALCFEYFKRGSLDKNLSDVSCGLDWNTRYKIIKGTCEGLDYLHNSSKDRNRPMYHLDLKPGNILLDDNFIPKIADFGLSRLFDDTKTHTTRTNPGTIQYVPPEYIDRRQISKKFDVYSLGIVIIEIVAGPSGYSKWSKQTDEMDPKPFIDDVKEEWKKRFQETSSYTLISQEADIAEVETCIAIALMSVQKNRKKRPTIREIVEELNKMETVRKSLMGQISERLAIDPLEVRFPSSKQRASCVLQLTNPSADDYVAFTAQMDQSKYSTEPDSGVLPPLSKTYMCITAKTWQAQRHDLLIIKCARVIKREGSATIYELVEGEAVEKATLPVVSAPVTPNPPDRLMALFDSLKIRD